MIKKIKFSKFFPIFVIIVLSCSFFVDTNEFNSDMQITSHSDLGSLNNSNQHPEPNLKNYQKSTQPNIHNVTSEEVYGSLPDSINFSNDQINVPMYYSAHNKYNLNLFTNQNLSFSQPVNVSLLMNNAPEPYGFDFNNYNASLAVQNTTLTSVNATGSSLYNYNKINNSSFDFTSLGSGGTIWSNFSISSSNNKSIFNPFFTPLLFNMSYEFLNAILPSDGMLYATYIDFKFNCNSSLVSSPFPSILRIYLLYTPNYAQYTLYNTRNNPNFWFYLNSNSNINILVKDINFNGTRQLSVNLTDILHQITDDLGLTAIIPYFNSFSGIEIGFFSTNSTLLRSNTLKVTNFVLFNKLFPSNIMMLTGSASTSSIIFPINNSVFNNIFSIINCFNIQLMLNLIPNLNINKNLLINNSTIELLVNISYFETNQFKVELTNLNRLIWSNIVSYIPIISFNNSVTNSALELSKKTILWFIDKNWKPLSLPTLENSHFLINSSNFLTSFTINSQTNAWFGGILNNNFSENNFNVSFYSNNKFSLFYIQSFILDNKLNLTFFNNQNLLLANKIELFQNQSNKFTPLDQLYINSNKSFFSISFFFNNESFLKQNFLLFLVSDNIKSGFLLQSFYLTNILKNYNISLACSYLTDFSNTNKTNSFILSIDCKFNSSFFTESYLNKLLVNVQISNYTYFFRFNSINLINNYMTFNNQIFLPPQNNLFNNSILVNYSVENLFYNNPLILWSNSSIIDLSISTELINNQINIYSSWPFYMFFFFVILLLIIKRKRKTQSIINDQVG